MTHDLPTTLNTAAAYITHTFPPAVHGELATTVRADHIDIQILRTMDPRDRHDTLTLIGRDVHVERYTFDGATNWGDASVTTPYRGVPVRVWTALSTADAEILGLVVTA